MLYHVGNSYFDLAEVSTVRCEEQSGDRPYTLTVTLKSGDRIGFAYVTKDARDREACNIYQAHGRACPEPVTRYELDAVVSQATEKVRRDLRAIKKILLEVHQDG